MDDQTDLAALGRAVAQGARLGTGEDTASAGPPPTLVTERRGSVTWRLPGAGDGGGVALKAAVRTSDGAPAATAALAREGAVLAAVPELAKTFAPRAGTVTFAGTDVPYLVTRWIDGEPAIRRIRTARRAGELRPAAVSDLLAAVLRPLAALHEAGWSHGDVQPDHLRRKADDDVVLIDYGLAQSPQLPMEDYRGGLVHFNAPEVCAGILAGGAAGATPRADVFAAASTVYFAAFDRVLGDYATGGEDRASWEEALEALAAGRFTFDEREAAAVLGRPLADLLARCLHLDPARRPADAREALRLTAQMRRCTGPSTSWSRHGAAAGSTSSSGPAGSCGRGGTWVPCARCATGSSG
jgi:serine/threonine protein kinase